MADGTPRTKPHRIKGNRPLAVRKYVDKKKKDRTGLDVLTGRPRKAPEELKPAKHVAYQNTAMAKARAAGVLCRHCVKSLVNRPRGLCWTCYYKPGVRDLYPSTSKYAKRGVGNFSGEAPLPAEPTTAAPGTPEKLEVMGNRAKMKQSLFHPADSRWAGDTRPLEFMAERASRFVNERCAA